MPELFGQNQEQAPNDRRAVTFSWCHWCRANGLGQFFEVGLVYFIDFIRYPFFFLFFTS